MLCVSFELERHKGSRTTETYLTLHGEGKIWKRMGEKIFFSTREDGKKLVLIEGRMKTSQKKTSFWSKLWIKKKRERRR